MRDDLFRCPKCKGRLDGIEDRIRCAECGETYPTIYGIPILLVRDRSLFDFPATGKLPDEPRWRRIAKALLPRMGHNLSARRCYPMFAELVAQQVRDGPAKVLVVGAGSGGMGIEQLRSQHSIDMVSLDVSPRGEVDVIADAHDLPFDDDFFDGVVIQAVIEHVLDPQRVVSEMHRVLRSDGIVYAETPFMQMVHERAYDFTRLTDLGHRYLFKQFTEIERGLTAGPGTTLLWAWCYFLRSFFRNRFVAETAMAIGRLTGFWLLWVDRLIGDTPGAYDSASGHYFIGRKQVAGETVQPRTLIRDFRGL